MQAAALHSNSSLLGSLVTARPRARRCVVFARPRVLAAAKPDPSVFNGEGPDFTMVDVENQPHLATQKPDFGHRQMAGQPGPPLPHAQTVWNGEGPDFTMADVEREHELAKLAAQPVWNGEGPEYDMKDVELTAEADRLKAATEAAAYVEGAAHNGEGAEYSMTQTKGY